MTRPVPAGLLLIADARLPAGGHVHSGGLEAAWRTGAVTDLASLRGFLLGRLTSTGRVAAAFAAAATRTTDWLGLDAELDARTPSAAQRAASRQQGRGLLRATGAKIPGLAGPHHPIAFGAVAAELGATAEEAAAVIALTSVTGPASAAVRLLALDPFGVQRILADIASTVDSVAAEAAVARPLADLPDDCAPLLDILADTHPHLEGQLFVS